MLLVSEDEFESIVKESLDAIEEKHKKAVQNVAVVIENYPNRHHRKVAGVEPGWTLYGLYEGVPLTERGEQYAFTVPDKISIFRAPILEGASTIDEARAIITNTIWHEFAHYFGMGEWEVHQREVKEGRDAF